MPHEIRRALRAFAARPWFIDPAKAAEMVAMLELRAAHGPRHAQEPRADRTRGPAAEAPAGAPAAQPDRIAVLRIRGVIAPRLSAMDELCGPGATSMEAFQAAFRQVAGDRSVRAIVLDVDSPGGTVDLVPETAAMIREARRADRPIVAVANTFAASAAYWLAAAADELVVTPSGEVGSIGVYVVHQDVSAALAAEGIAVTFIAEGPRKVEGNFFEPLSAEGAAALRTSVRHYYDMFTRDVAKFRGVPVSTVRADPEKDEAHFGGGRVYPAAIAVERGMADRVATLDETLARLQAETAGSPARRRTAMARRRLALL